MRPLVWLVTVIAVASLTAPTAQAGPLEDLLENVPEESVPTNGGLVTETLDKVKNEIERIAGNPHQGPAEQVRQAVEVVSEWVKNIGKSGNCAEISRVDVNGGDPVVPPRIETVDGNGETSTIIDAGGVIIVITTRDNCLGTNPQSQSWPGGG